MPKNVSCNSFYMFMIETRKRLESRGERFPRGLEDVVEVAAGLWENMSQEQKNVYKEKAKDYKKSDEFSQHKKTVKSRMPRRMQEDENAAGGARARRRPVAERPVEEEEFQEPMAYLVSDFSFFFSYFFLKRMSRENLQYVKTFELRRKCIRSLSSVFYLNWNLIFLF